jgi:DNA-binding NarL/FixJ family response regulator
MSRPRVLLAEDHEAVREQLRVLLQADFEVIAAVADGYALVGAAQALRPDVIVTDVAMPGLSGLEAAVRLIATDSAARVIFVSVHTEAALVRRGLEIGAVGYVLKQSAGEGVSKWNDGLHDGEILRRGAIRVPRRRSTGADFDLDGNATEP